MKATYFAAGAALLALTLAACQPAPTTGNQADANAAAAENTPEGQLRALEAQWNRDWASKDVGAIMSHWAADATLMSTDAAPATGHAAIRPMVEQMVGDAAFSLTFSPDRVHIAPSGDFGVTRGAYTLRLSSGTVTGAYVTVYRRRADGGWEAIEDIVSNGPLANAAAAPPPAAGNAAEPANAAEAEGNDTAPPANTVGM
jgi:ketosteroid isomerase-like protein